MPETRSVGGLVAPSGRESEGLSTREYYELKTALSVLRRRDDSDMSYSVLSHLLMAESFDERQVEEWDGLRGFLEWIDTNEGSEGILVDNRSQSSLRQGESSVKEILRLHGDEYVDLENMLVVIRNGGWFGRWISTLVNSVARSDHPTEKYPTPLQVMQTLTLDNGEFLDSLAAAKDLAEQRPDLLFPVMRCEGDPPAESATIPRPVSTATKTKLRRARKGARKAA
jgi:hypothetical protein